MLKALPLRTVRFFRVCINCAFGQIDEYGSSLLEKWNDPQLARAGPSQKQIDGNSVATQLCDNLNVSLFTLSCISRDEGLAPLRGIHARGSPTLRCLSDAFFCTSSLVATFFKGQVPRLRSPWLPPSCTASLRGSICALQWPELQYKSPPRPSTKP